MKTSDCREAQEWIIADLDEGLVETERELLEKHLMQCDACRTMKDETVRLFASLADDIPPEPDADFWAEHQASLEEKILRSDVGGHSRNRWKAVALALAAALAFLAVWVGYFDPFGGRTSSNEAALPVVIEELDRVYGPVAEEGDVPQVSTDKTLTASNGLSLREETVAEWFATEYDPFMLWL